MHKDGQVHGVHIPASPSDRDGAALPARRAPLSSRSRSQRIGLDAEDTVLGQPDEQFAHANSVAFHVGSLLCVASSTRKTGRVPAFL